MQISYNLRGVLTGIAIVLTGSLVAYGFQRHLFSKWRQRAPNALEKKTG